MATPYLFIYQSNPTPASRLPPTPLCTPLFYIYMNKSEQTDTRFSLNSFYPNNYFVVISLSLFLSLCRVFFLFLIIIIIIDASSLAYTQQLSNQTVYIKNFGPSFSFLFKLYRETEYIRKMFVCCFIYPHHLRRGRP